MTANRKAVFKTPFFTVWSIDEGGIGNLDAAEPYYGVEPADYVCVVALTRDNELVLVRQHRPVVGTETLELPAGCVDPGETAEDAARRELMEETGYRADELEPLGALLPDTGRLCNKEWCFFAPNVTLTDSDTEPGIETLTVPVADLDRMVASGELCAALHLAGLHVARAKGLLAG